ncbi:MAG: hypothetical protein AAF677_09370 [Pseudomonadota bacterium]
MIETLNDEAHRDDAAGPIQTLIDRIVLTPDAPGARLAVDLRANLADTLVITALGTRGATVVAAKSLASLT